MLKNWHPYFYETPKDGGATGTADNGAASVSGASSSGGYVPSESAMDAMIKAASSLSSEETPATGGDAGTVTKPAGAAGDTADAGAKPQTGATGQPQTGDGVVRGEAPQSRIEAAVKNARTEVEKQYEWTKGIPESRRAEITTGFSLIDDIRRDPVEFTLGLIHDLKVRGVDLVAQLMGNGRREAGATGEPAAENFKLPQGRLVGEDGTRAYSTDQMGEIVEGLTKHILSQVDTRMKPTTQYVAQSQEEREQASLHQQARDNRDAIMTEMRQLTHFTKENEPAILAIAKSFTKEQRVLLGPAGTIQRAYALFVERDVIPKQQLSSEETVRKENAKKVATSIGQQSTTGATSGAKAADIKGPSGLAAHMERLSTTDLSGRF